MANSAPSPTPSEDNRKNERDDLTANALDHIMKNDTQSYDDFLGGFTYLKNNKPDLVPSLQQRATENQLRGLGKPSSPATSTTIGEPVDTGPVKGTRNVVNDIKRRRLGKIIVGSHTASEDVTQDDLETEVLEEGQITSRLAGKSVIKTGSVKVDNFVDDEEDEIEDTHAEYTASFSTGSNPFSTKPFAGVFSTRTTTSETTTKSKSTSSSSATDLDTSDIHLTDSDTDKLLANFLADLQNEMNEMGPSGDTQLTGHRLTTDNPATSHRATNSAGVSDANSIQALIDQECCLQPKSNTNINQGKTLNSEKEQVAENPKHSFCNDNTGDSARYLDQRDLCSEKDIKNIQPEKIKEKNIPDKVNANSGLVKDDIDDNEDEVNFDDDDCDDALNLCDDTTRTIEVKIGPGELEQVAEKEMTQKDRKAAQLTEIYRSALMDSEGNVRSLAAQAQVEMPDEEVPQGDVIFPGQIEESSDMPVYENTTLLEFKATYRDARPTTNNSSTEDTGEGSDRIEPFTLDENFDYDNVVLTPKFSMEQLNKLRREL